MDYPEYFINLKKMFEERYGTKINQLNSNIVDTPVLSDGTFEVPTIKFGSGGGMILPFNKEHVALEKPAEVSVSIKKVEPMNVIYRISIPCSECEIAVKKPLYFSYLFDRIVGQGLGNYNVTFGGPDLMRFGQKYISYTLTFLNDDYIELRFKGQWASDKEVL